MPLRSPLILLALLAAALSLPVSSQEPASPANSALEAIAQARDKLHVEETAHPGNSVEVAQALDDLVGLQLDGQLANSETLALVDREVAVAETAAGPHSKIYVMALGTQSEVYLALSRPAEARPLAERGFEIAEKEFPDTDDFFTAADHLAIACMILGDYPCALRTYQAAIAGERKAGPGQNDNLVRTLTNLAELKERMGDMAGAGQAAEESLATAIRSDPKNPHIAVLENNLAVYDMRTQQFDKAIEHLTHARDLDIGLYGPDSPIVVSIGDNLANVYSRTGQFARAWELFDAYLKKSNDPIEMQARQRSMFAQSLASGGSLDRAIAEALIAARQGRDSFVLQARTLPERQALAFAAQRPHGVDTALSILVRHPDLPLTETYQEVVRSRALVADEMARRQRNLNSNNDPQVARLLEDENQARAELLAAEGASSGTKTDPAAVALVTRRMEKIERALAERSAAFRGDERAAAVSLEDLRANLPPAAVLISYATYQRTAVEALDPAHQATPAYIAFVLHSDSKRIRLFDLGDARPIENLVARARAAADAEAHSAGMGSLRNEREYRLAAEALRKLIWDPLRADLGDPKLALVVPDGVLNLIPFSSFPDGTGYLVEHGPVIHLLTSERDLVPAEPAPKKSGLLAVGSPAFDVPGSSAAQSPLRDAPGPCDDFRIRQFHPLPGAAAEVADIGSSWRRWNHDESSAVLTGGDATRSRFIDQAVRSRVLHVATHAFLLDKSCGSGNPLLHSGLVFAGANRDRDTSILTAQQIASLDLSGVEWAVLSACNTGGGELRDGEGVLGLQRAFRVAGARSVVMTLWPVDDDVTRQFMHLLYAERLGRRASTADAVWNSARKLLIDRRAAGKSTHPWYWAGFVGSGGWE